MWQDNANAAKLAHVIHRQKTEDQTEGDKEKWKSEIDAGLREKGGGKSKMKRPIMCNANF